MVWNLVFRMSGFNTAIKGMLTKKKISWKDWKISSYSQCYDPTTIFSVLLFFSNVNYKRS